MVVSERLLVVLPVEYGNDRVFCLQIRYNCKVDIRGKVMSNKDKMIAVQLRWQVGMQLAVVCVRMVITYSRVRINRVTFPILFGVS